MDFNGNVFRSRDAFPNSDVVNEDLHDLPCQVFRIHIHLHQAFSIISDGNSIVQLRKLTLAVQQGMLQPGFFGGKLFGEGREVALIEQAPDLIHV